MPVTWLYKRQHRPTGIYFLNPVYKRHEGYQKTNSGFIYHYKNQEE